MIIRVIDACVYAWVLRQLNNRWIRANCWRTETSQVIELSPQTECTFQIPFGWRATRKTWTCLSPPCAKAEREKGGAARNGAAHGKRYTTSKFSLFVFSRILIQDLTKKPAEKTAWKNIESSQSYGTFCDKHYMDIHDTSWLWSRFSPLCDCGRCVPFRMSRPK